MLNYQRVTIEFWACLFTNQEITKGPKPYRSLAPLHPTTKACKSSQKPSRFHARSCKNGVSLFLKQPHVSLGFSKNVQVPHPYHLSGNDYVCVCVCICLYIYTHIIVCPRYRYVPWYPSPVLCEGRLSGRCWPGDVVRVGDYQWGFECEAFVVRNGY